MSGGKGKSKSQITGYKYSMAVHSGIGRGPLNEFCEVRVGDLVAWTGSVTYTDSISIDAADLFGGDTKEGGIVGTAYVYMGEADQTIADIIVDNIEGGDPVPDWRGTATFFYYGQIGSNNPYPKSWKFRVKRTTKGWDNDDPWYPDKCLISDAAELAVSITILSLPKDSQYVVINDTTAYFRDSPGIYDVAIGDTTDATASNLAAAINLYTDVVHATATASGNVVELFGTPLPVVQTPYAFASHTDSGSSSYGMNPAHIIYECATNGVWGRGLPASMIDDDGFRAAADTLYDEGFGLCLMWTRQDDIDAFVQTVINHISGVIYIDRQTGLLTLKLLRDDYDHDALPVYDFTNGLIDITEDQLSASDTMYNEIIVKYKDPVLDKVGQVRVQNLASFQSLGTVISQTTEYLGCPTASMALRLAQRDLEIKSSELRRLTLKFDRHGWAIAPGSVFKVHAPTRGIENIILRAADIEEDTLTGETITVKALQDVFGLPETSFIDPQESFYKPPDRTPRVITEALLTEMTYFDAADSLPPSILSDIVPNTGMIKVFARQPNATTTQYDLQTVASGEADFVTRSTAGFDPSAALIDTLDCYDTVMNIEDGIMLADASLGELVLIDDEYMRLDGINLIDGTLTVARGCVDSIPARHEVGAWVWFQVAAPTTDFRDYASGELVDARLISRTSSQTLDPTFAIVYSITIGARQGRPYPPGDVKVNGTPFGDDPLIVPGDVTVTWVHRDRILQGDNVVEHQFGSIGPEPGTTYTIRVYGPDGLTLLRTVSPLVSTTWTYTTGNQMSDGNPRSIWIELELVRDSLVSWQHYRFQVYDKIGFDEGFDYYFDGLP